MKSLHSRCLADLSSAEIRDYLESEDTILIPMGSCEMHGNHLPLGTDIYNALEVARRAAEISQTVYAPPLWFGYSPQHLRGAGQGMGTMTLQATTLNALIYDVARSLVHHGFNRLIFVNGHTSNMKVVDPTMRRLRYETGALIAIFKCYGERYLDLIADVLENPPEETPGWHGSEEETSIMLAYDEEVVHMDLAVQGQTHAPDWMPEAFAKTDGTWDVQFKGYEYFYFPMDHDEFADDGVIGNPMRATKRKGEEIFRRFAEHLAEGVVELRKAPVSIRSRQFEGKA